MLRNYELERIYNSPEHQQIKLEPRGTPPHHNISSPPLHAYTPQYEQNWGIDNMQGGLGVPGASHVNPAAPGGHGNPFLQDMWASQPYGQVSPGHMQSPAMNQNMQVLQPNMQALSPNMQALSPNMQAMSPNVQPMSPNMQPLSPNLQQAYVPGDRMSPNMGVLSPHAQGMSPGMQGVAPMGRISPNMPQNMGHISPNLMQQQPAYAQQPHQQSMMETEGHSGTTLSNLLLDRGDASLLLNSGELSGLSALLGERGPQALDY